MVRSLQGLLWCLSPPRGVTSKYWPTAACGSIMAQKLDLVSTCTLSFGCRHRPAADSGSICLDSCARLFQGEAKSTASGYHTRKVCPTEGKRSKGNTPAEFRVRLELVHRAEPQVRTGRKTIGGAWRYGVQEVYISLYGPSTVRGR